MFFSMSNLIQRGFSLIARNEKIPNLKHKLCRVDGGPRDIKKSITVAIIGKANVGKSTLINAIMGMHICAASEKPQTTMKYQRVFHIEDDTQIVILDTPGIVSAKNKKKYNITDQADVFTIKEVRNVDLLGVVVDASDKYSNSALPSNVKRLITTFPSKTEMVLILNKVDQVKVKIDLLKYVDKLCGEMESNKNVILSNRFFSRVFMISALENDGVDTLVDYIRSIAITKKCKSSETLSDHPDHEIVRERVRAALLDHFKHNIPYACSCEVEYLEENVLGKVNIIVLIRCPTDSIQRIVGNISVLEKISFICGKDLENIFKKPVFLKLNVAGPNKKKNR